jgi:hypothetical protein
MSKNSVMASEENVFDTCQALQVYPNPNGDIVLRQAGWPDEDTYVIIPIYHVEKVIKAIRQAKKDSIDLANA